MLVELIGATLRAVPDFRGKGFIAVHALGPLLRGRGRETVVQLVAPGGGKLICNLDDWIPWSVSVYGDFHDEREYARFMIATATGSNVVLDIGANIGYYTIQFSRVSAGTVYAFEPMAYQFSVLERNTALNGLTNVVLTKAAVSDMDGHIQVYFAGMGNTGGSSAWIPSDRSENVPTVTVDGFAREYGLDAIDIVKIDVEGHELHVLQGMAGLLARRAVRHLFIEMNSYALAAAGTTPTELAAYLRAFGYRPHSIRTGTPSAYSLERPDEELVYFFYAG